MRRKISVMVADDDEVYARRFGEFVAGRKDMEFAGYALDGEEATELFSLVRPDAVVLDILMPRLDGMGFLRRLRLSERSEKPVILVNSMSRLKSMVAAAEKAGADYFTVKPQPFSAVCDTIAELCSSAAPAERTAEYEDTGEEMYIERGAARFLRALGVPANLDGYKYIRTAIIKAAEDMSILEPITKKLYPMIADEYQTNGSCVERSMRHAIKVSWQRGNRKMMNDIFGYTIDDNKKHPTNSEYIAMAADDFRLRCRYGMLDNA